MRIETHRCSAKPEPFSVRRYGEPSILPHGWVLARRTYDTEGMSLFLDNVTFGEDECIRFCPWCGKRLPE